MLKGMLSLLRLSLFPLMRDTPGYRLGQYSSVLDEVHILNAEDLQRYATRSVLAYTGCELFYTYEEAASASFSQVWCTNKRVYFLQ